MALGFVLIKVGPLKEYEVFNALSRIPQIIEAHPLFGQFDLIAKLEAKDLKKLEDIILNEIRTIKGIIETETLTCAQL